jgi:hypothetical protein
MLRMQTDRSRRLKRVIGEGGWLEAAEIASLVFLTLMAVGAFLLLAGKLHLPSLGSGAGPLDVLRGIGLVGLATLGVTIDIGGLELSVIPLGALAFVIVSGARVARDVFRREIPSRMGGSLKVGAVLAMICALAALVFRFDGSVPVTASPVGAAMLGFIWGTVIGGIGASLAAGWRPDAAHRTLSDGPIGEGMRQGARMFYSAALGALAALLCVIIGRLVSDPLPRSFGIGDALAATLYLIAFLPNVLGAVFSLAVGATLTIGAQVDVGGKVVGPLRQHSLFEWGRGGTDLLVLLLLLPLCISIAGGIWAARREGQPSTLAGTIVVASATLGLAVGILAAFADARLGAGLVEERGVGLVAIDALQAGLLTFLWSAGGGTLGAVVNRQMRERSVVTV